METAMRKRREKKKKKRENDFGSSKGALDISVNRACRGASLLHGDAMGWGSSSMQNNTTASLWQREKREARAREQMLHEVAAAWSVHCSSCFCEAQSSNEVEHCTPLRGHSQVQCMDSPNAAPGKSAALHLPVFVVRSIRAASCLRSE